jgi:hypothetical protein
MTNRYKIIWIDDQFDEQESFIDQAEREGFEIAPFKTSKEGMSFLGETLHDVDAVILDAKVFTESVADTPTERGLLASLTKIASLSGQNNGREIPHVIFTGQADLCDDEEFAEKMNGIPVFSKSRSNDALFGKLRELIGDSHGATLRNRYPAAYAACEWMEGDCWRILFPILQSLRSGVGLMSDPYNDLRKVLEISFRKLHEVGIIHERLIENGIVNLQGSSLFLAGMEARFGREGTSVKAKEAVIPKLIGEQVKFVLNVCQVGSHTEGNHEIPEKRPSILDVERWNPNHHLLETATLMTLDVIVWAKAFIDASPNPIQNMENWEPELIPQRATGMPLEVEGEVMSGNTRGDFFVRPREPEVTEHKNICIGQRLVKTNELSVGVRVRVTTSGRVLGNGALAADHYTCL